MTRLAAFFLGLVLGISVAILGLRLRDGLAAKAYTVQSISSHHPDGNANSQTTLVVYRAGQGGHVMEVKCAFPPGFRFTDDPGTDELWHLVNVMLNGGFSEEQVDVDLAVGGYNTTVADLRQRVAGWRVRVTRTVGEESLLGGTYYLCSRAP